MSLSYLDALYGVISGNAAIMSMINNKLFKEKKIEGSNNDFKESNKSLISCEAEIIGGDKHSTDLILIADVWSKKSKEYAEEIAKAVKELLDDGISFGGVTLYVSKITGKAEFFSKIVGWRVRTQIECTTNTPPEITSISVYPLSPQVAETEIQFIANCTNTEEDELVYKFWLSGPATNNIAVDMTGWTTNARWLWKTSISDTGSNTITVQVRDQRHTGPGSYDDQETAAFTVTS